MKKIYILILTPLFIIACTNIKEKPVYSNSNKVYLEKGLVSTEVQMKLKKIPDEVKKIAVNNDLLAVESYSYITSYFDTMESYKSSSKEVKSYRVTKPETDTLFVLYNKNGESSYWGLLYEYLRSNDTTLNEVGKILKQMKGE